MMTEGKVLIMDDLANIADENERDGYSISTSAALVAYVKEIFETFKAGRAQYEEVWEECWSNFIGKYQQNKAWKTKTEGRGTRSKIFIKLTALKCNTAHSKISDVLFAGRGGVPFDVKAIADESPAGQDVVNDIARAMKEKLREQFKAIGLKRVVDLAILEASVYGTGILKAPVVTHRRTPMAVLMPTIDGEPAYGVQYSGSTSVEADRVSIWNYYTDVNAAKPSEAIGEIHIERLLPATFRMIGKGGGYDAAAMSEAERRATTDDPYGSDRRHIQLGDAYSGAEGEKDKRVAVLEYWGLVPVHLLRGVGVQLPDEAEDDDSIEALVVLAADGILLKASVNPLRRRPFFICPWKERPGSIYGMGVAEAMRDSQKMVNSCARLIIDNKALSGNGMVALNIDRINTKRTPNLEIYPGKVWYTKGNFSPREAVDAVSFPDITLGLQQLMEMFERFADEETGIPRYTHGEQGGFLNKTAAGMSMLMSQANLTMKAVLENIDDYWIEPIVEMFGNWFWDMEGSGEAMPLRFIATGTDSLMAKEIKMESYLKVMQVTSAPQDAVFVDRAKLMKNIFDLLEAGDVLRPDEEVKAMLEQMGAAATQQKDIREMVDWDRLYPYLQRSEQVQILNQLGIQPEETFQTAIHTAQEPQQQPQQPGGGMQ